MAVMNVTYMSYCLKRYVDFKVILPIEDTKSFDKNPSDKPNKFKTLYLLHGFANNAGDYLYSSRIFKIARDLNLAIVFPSGENSFYVDHEDTEMLYGSYVGKELVEVTRKMFPLSSKREDTFIGGISMGGFGSLLVGSRFAETFDSIFCLSGGFITEDLVKEEHPDYLAQATLAFFKSIFGDFDTIKNSEKDPLFTSINAHNKGILPALYMACGKEDYIYDNNVNMVNKLRDSGINLCWEVASGKHDWFFWDVYLEKAIHWCLAQKDKQI